VYKEPPPTTADFAIELYTHGLLKDDWRFNFRNTTGATENYKFVRNYSNKQGMSLENLSIEKSNEPHPDQNTHFQEKFTMKSRVTTAI
jgi:hypothetical protein